MKYREKSATIEAVQLRWDNWSEMCEHAGVGALTDGKPEGVQVDDNGEVGGEHIGLHIPTPEGLALAVEGDYVVREDEGELSIWKPDLFKETYELVGFSG